MSVPSSSLSQNMYTFLSSQELTGCSKTPQRDRPFLCPEKMIQNFANHLIAQLNPQTYRFQIKRLETIAGGSLSKELNHLETLSKKGEGPSGKEQSDESLLKCLLLDYKSRFLRILKTLPKEIKIAPCPIFPAIGSVTNLEAPNLETDLDYKMYALKMSMECIENKDVDGALFLLRFISDERAQNAVSEKIMDQLIKEKDFDTAFEFLKSFSNLNTEMKNSLLGKLGSSSIEEAKIEKAIQIIENWILPSPLKDRLLLEISCYFFMNEQVQKAVEYIKSVEKITTSDFLKICGSHCSDKDGLRRLEDFGRLVIPDFLQDRFFVCLIPYLTDENQFERSEMLAKRIKDKVLQDEAFCSISEGYIQRKDFDGAASMAQLISNSDSFSLYFIRILNQALKKGGIEGAVNLIRTYFSNRMTPSILSSFVGQIDSRDVREELEKRLNDFLL